MKAFEPLDTSRMDFPSEADLARLMCRHIRHIEGYWNDDPNDMGHFGSLDMNTWMPPGGPINEEVIRSMTQELMGYAVLYKSPHFDADLAVVSRAHLLDRLNRCLRWIAAHHLTGELRTQPLQWDGQWGDDWESSLWAGQYAMAAYWVWDALEADVRERALRLLAFEADRFVGVDPPDGRWLDTKAEENAWDSFLIAWAYCMQPDHPHAAEWLDRGKAFALNTFTTDRDRVDMGVIDGRAVREWVCAQTAHPDMTVENHGSFHPGYLGCGGMLLEGRLAFQKMGMAPPPHYMHHVLDVWDILKRFYLCNGFTSYPSRQDWGYHWPYVSIQEAVMAGEFGDEVAGHLFWERVRYADEAMRHAGDGRFDGRIPHADGGRYFQFESGGMGSFAAVMMAGVPEVQRMRPDAFRRKQVGCEAYPFVWMQVRRSRAGLFGFSWRSLGHRAMGTVIPAGGESTFGADQDGLVGRFEIDGKPARPRVICHTDHTTDLGFRTTGEIHYGDGRIVQHIAVAALEDGETVVVMDLAEAQPGTPVTGNEGLGIYAMNDFMNNNRVAIAYEGGQNRVRGVGGKAQVIETGSAWMRVAGCLGVATDGLPLLYEDAAERNTPARWKSVLQDRVFVRPEGNGAQIRDFCAVLRMGRGGARRAGEGPERLDASGDRVRACRVLDGRKRTVTVVANFGVAEVTAEVAGVGTVRVAAMDVAVVG